MKLFRAQKLTNISFFLCLSLARFLSRSLSLSLSLSLFFRHELFLLASSIKLFLLFLFFLSLTKTHISFTSPPRMGYPQSLPHHLGDSSSSPSSSSGRCVFFPVYCFLSWESPLLTSHAYPSNHHWSTILLVFETKPFWLVHFEIGWISIGPLIGKIENAAGGISYTGF